MSANDGSVPDVHPDLYIAIPILALTLASISVGLRYYVRIFMLRSFGIDDWALLAAYVFLFIHVCIFIAFGTIIKRHGLVESFETLIKILEFQGLAYGVDQILVKIALATFFMTIVPRRSWQYKVIVGSTAVFTVFTIGQAFTNLFQCGNPTDLDNPHPRCLSIHHLQILTYVSVVFNAVMDWIMVLLPITVVYKSLMSSHMKFTVCFIILLGVGGSIISVVRIATIKLGVISSDLNSFNTSRIFLFLAQWENTTGIIAVSLAALRPLIKQITKQDQTHPTRWTPTLGGSTQGKGTMQSMGLNSLSRQGRHQRSSSKEGILTTRTYEVEGA